MVLRWWWRGGAARIIHASSIAKSGVVSTGGGLRFGRLAGVVHRHRPVRQLPDNLSVEAIDIRYALAPVLLLRKADGRACNARNLLNYFRHTPSMIIETFGRKKHL